MLQTVLNSDNNWLRYSIIGSKILNMLEFTSQSIACDKPRPHAAMLHTCDFAFEGCCDGLKLHAMCCDKKLKMLNILVAILEFLSYLPSDFQTVFSLVIRIP